MLTATISGELFASPSVANIVTGIQLAALPGSEVLLIVTNYTGDRLNFGLAAEIARNEHDYRVKMLLVDDDCAIEDVRASVGRRGLAGTLLVHKICGAMAVLGIALEEIYQFTWKLLKERRLLTIGFSFEILDGQLVDVEIGRGLHGEPGVQKLEEPLDNFNQIIEIVLEKFLQNIAKDSEVIALFNNLGGVSELIFNRFIGDFLRASQSTYKIVGIMKGPFFTSLNSQAISETILDLGQDKKELLDHLSFEVDIAAGIHFNLIEITEIELPKEIVNRSEVDLQAKAIKDEFQNSTARKCLQEMFKILRENKAVLNEMDSEFGDGDTGTLVCVGVEGLEAALAQCQIDFSSRRATVLGLASELQKCMGGSFGAICCLFLQGVAASIDENSSLEQLWHRGLQAGIACIQNYSLAQVGDRTVIDVLIPMRDALNSTKATQNSWTESTLPTLWSIASTAAKRTRHMLPRSGRAAYTFSSGRQIEAKYADPGQICIIL